MPEGLIESATKQKIDQLVTKFEGFPKILPPDPYRTEGQLREKAKEETKGLFTRFFEKLITGINEILGTWDFLDPKLVSPQVKIPQGKLWEAFCNMEENLQRGKLPKDICGLSESTMKDYNRIAAYLYEKKQYDKAAPVYALLTFLDASQPAYWLGYGNAEYYSKNYGAALRAYEMASKVDPQDIQCLFYACHCYHQMGQIDKAIGCIDRVLAIAAVKPNLAEWGRRAEQLKAFFNKIVMTR